MLCRVDVREFFAGRAGVDWVLRHVDRLTREPWSHYRAELLEEAAQIAPVEGQRERDRLTLPYLGWGRPEVQRAEIQAALYVIASQGESGTEPWQPSDELTASAGRVAASTAEILAFLTPPTG